MTSTVVADVAHVTRRFGTFTALDDVTLQVAEGEVFGLLGHNGAGKTTLLRVLNGLLVSHGGSVSLLGMDPIRDGKALRRRTGVLTEYPALAELLSARENLAIYASIHGMAPTEIEVAISETLNVLGLGGREDEPVRGFSAGLKQRVALARALVHKPDVLMLDEPTTNMDPVAAKDVRTLIHRIARAEGRTVILSTHNLAEASELCDRVAIVRHGRIIAVGSPAELAARFAAGVTVSIEVGPGEADRAATALPSPMAVEVINGRTLRVADADQDVPAIVRKLVEAGHDVHAVTPHQPTLEDVYLHLHDGERLS
ncbi:MAG: ABC transporter ATP-binding protein [Nitriliruptorales bacterium]|nr:ABC transporter ATP-binding protein [Nitriliruptorales bacterium]